MSLMALSTYGRVMYSKKIRYTGSHVNSSTLSPLRGFPSITVKKEREIYKGTGAKSCLSNYSSYTV
jgi:hypothetical protein